jgi:L-ascorbate metabolism protein UlaG (beta-lactamase superfamily)
LGQAGFRLNLDGLTILIDPFLSDHEARLFVPPDPVAMATGVDWLLATHEHLDHLDRPFVQKVATQSPEVTLAVPAPLVDEAREIAPMRIVGVKPGDRLDMSPEVGLHVTPAWHGVEVGDGYSLGNDEGGIARFVGYIIRGPGLSVYHSGDTLVTDELVGRLRGEKIDIALLPINGRDYYREARGLVGNMDAREAVQLAAELGVSILVPMHWDLFSGNTVRPANVLDEIVNLPSPNLHVMTLARYRPCPLPRFP